MRMYAKIKSGYRKMYFIASKSEVSNILRKFITEMKTKRDGQEMNCIRTDNGTKYIYVNSEFHGLLL